MKYLVIGAGGFLGSTLVRQLQAAGEKVYGTRRSAAGREGFSLDINRPEQFSALDVQPDVVINCASVLPDASRRFSDPDYLRQLFETNVLGAANLMNWAAERQVEKVINCSTLVVVDKPWPVPLTEEANTYPLGGHVGYSASKLSQELVMRSMADAHGIQLLQLRLSALYGPGMKGGGILQKLLRQTADRGKVQLTNGTKVSFDFLHVADAAKIIYKLSQQEQWRDKVLNLAAGEEIFLLELAELLCALQGMPKEQIINADDPAFLPSRAVIDTSRLEGYLKGTGIHTRPFAEKVKSMIHNP